MSNVGIEVDKDGKVIKRPRKEDLKKFRSSYKKAQAQLAKDKPSLGTGPASQAFFRALGSPDASPARMPSFDPAAPIGFVCGIQEPPWLHKRVIGLSGHTMLLDHTCDQPRAALFYTRNLNIWPVAEFIRKDICTGLLITPTGERIYISSLYMPSDVAETQMITSEMLLLLMQVKKEKASIISMIDSNSWSQALWNMDRTNLRGEIMENFIFNNNLMVHNKGNKYTYVRYNSQTIIDITVSTPRVGRLIEGNGDK